MTTETLKEQQPIAGEDAAQPHMTEQERDAITPLIREIIEETELRQKAGLLNLEKAALHAERRVAALEVLHRAAINATKPIHWLLYRDKQGIVFARFNNAGSERIATVYGVRITPTTKVEITDKYGPHKTAEIYGDVYSETLNITIHNVRSYRVEGEDFLGRSATDTKHGSKDVAGVGDNDWIQSTETGLRTKCTRVVTGIITVSPQELADVWGMTVEDVLQQCRMGHGFSRDERATAGASAGSAIKEGQVKRMFGIAYGVIKAKGYKVKSADIVQQCIEHVVRKVKGASASTKPEDVTLDCYEAICKLIETWEPGKIPPPQAAPAAPSTTSNGGEDQGDQLFATPGQVTMLNNKGNDRAKTKPEAETDGAAILYEAIYKVFGDHRPADKVPQNKLTEIVAAINGWGEDV